MANGPFARLRDEFVTYGDAVRQMYQVEALMRKSDFGRLNPERAQELARRAAGIPDHVTIGRTSIAEWENEPERG